jgi:hypothetical protein
MRYAARAELESLLRARKLDATLTSAAPGGGEVAETGSAPIDDAIGGGLARGQLSEIVGSRSSGRTIVLCRTLAAAAARGEAVALIDPCDMFDPASADAAGVDLSKLLWVRDRGDAGRAIKALNLVVQAGGFGVVACDLADVAPAAIRQLPYTTWMRIARVIEGSRTAVVVVAAERLARSPGGVTIRLEAPDGEARGRWSGSERARLLRAIELRPRVVGGRFAGRGITADRDLAIG